MDLSIVIRCGDDERVFDCIRSIDEDVEIMVSTSENPEFQSKLEARGIHYCLSPRGNLSKVSNIGFNHVKHERVIITDSDTIFEKGAIKEMYLALDEYDVVRAKLRFLADEKKHFSKIVAEARDYVNSLPLVFTPGIGIKKGIIKRIGGFLFNDPVPFAVDADLDYRIKQAKIPVKYLSNAVVYHDAESIRHDMKAAYRIGVGCMTSAIYLSRQIHNNQKHPRKIVSELKGVKTRHLRDVIRKKGAGVFAYQIFWDFLFHFGKNRRWMTRHQLSSGSE
jgi:GT2 family glycosyltransferase